jgi:hypothetical protein
VKRLPNKLAGPSSPAIFFLAIVLTALLIGAIPYSVGLLNIAFRIYLGFGDRLPETGPIQFYTVIFGVICVGLGAIVALVLWLIGLLVTWLVVKRLQS